MLRVSALKCSSFVFLTKNSMGWGDGGGGWGLGGGEVNWSMLNTLLYVGFDEAGTPAVDCPSPPPD